MPPIRHKCSVCGKTHEEGNRAGLCFECWSAKHPALTRLPCGHIGRKAAPNAPCANCRVARWKKENPEAYERHRRAERDRSLRRKFGITLEEYDRLLAEQGGVCAICGKPPKKVKLSVDHEHSIEGKKSVRGLLCFKCNYGLRWYADNPELLRKAAAYIERFLLRGGESAMHSGKVQDVTAGAA